MDDELSLKDTLYNILNGLQSEKNWRETGEGLTRVRDIIPNVTESLSRGGIAQAIGTSGDLRDIRNTVNSYLPKSVRNFTQAAEFLTNPYQTAIVQTAPTTESTKEFVPRITETYPGYEQHETLGEYIAPSLGYFGGKALKAGKDMPAGLSIIGPESKIWNKEMAFTAGKLEAKGATPDEILQKTGMVRGLDNQWRSEISDLPAKMKEGETFGEIHGKVGPNATVKDVLEHPQLFEAYPHLGEVNIATHSNEIPARGSYNQGKNLITLRENLNPEEAKSVLLHELTHGVQGAEEFNRGASAAQLTRFYEKKQQALLPKIAELSDQMREANMAGDMEKYRQIMTERDALSQEYTKMNPEEQGYEDYFRHGGEAEARMVQRRMDLTPEELRKNYPYQYTGETGKGLDINPDESIITTKQPGTINMPEQSIEPPKSKQDELGFHSALETAVLGIKQPKGTGEQFLKQLEKTPGVKTEELEVTGLKKFLQDHPTVTKQEVEKYIAQQRLELENKVLEKGTGADESEYQLQGGDVYHDQDYINADAEDLLYEMKNDPDIYHEKQQELVKEYPELYEGFEHEPDVAARLNDHVDERLRQMAQDHAHENYYDNPIRHYYDEHGYDIYGSDDTGYTVRDPRGNIVELGGRNGLYDISEVESELRMHHLDEGNLDVHEGGAKYADYILPGRHENYREILTTLPANLDPNIIGSKEYRDALKNVATDRENSKLGEMLRQAEREDYKSGHYDEANILAHMRVNDRIIDGKKTLMVEEIQSDWHQAGRKKGYTDETKRISWDDPRYVKARNESRDAINAFNNAHDNPALQATLRAELDRANAAEDVFAMANRKVSEGVPDAPFKKNWHEMMVKQALDIAAKGDYDAVAFTTGKQQADRYSLSKQINELRAEKLLSGSKEGQYVITATNKNGNPSVNKTVTEDELENLIGKDLAKKIVEDSPNYPDGKTYSGLDLDVGGEGMKGFYDKIIPDFINKYTKKWGMGMKKADLKNDQVHFVELSDTAKKDIKEKGQPLFSGVGLAAPALMPEDQDKRKK